MKIIILGYNGHIGRNILEVLAKNIKKNKKIDLICVGRETNDRPFKNKKIRYIQWNFNEFSKSKLYFFKKNCIIINCVGKTHGDIENIKKINFVFIKKLINHIQNNKILVRLIHLGSVSVYGSQKKYITKIKTIRENSITIPYDKYSESKLEADTYIQNISKINKKNFSFTILRVTNVFSELKYSSSFRLIDFLLKKGIWFKCSELTKYHFIHVKDVALAVFLTILYFKKSRNKIYNVSDDINQIQLHKIYSKKYNSNLFTFPISLKYLNLIIKNIPIPKILLNFFLTISSQITYNNSKIKKELRFHCKYSLAKK